MTLGHEVAASLKAVGDAVSGLAPGNRVCLHYNITCGSCPSCASGNEQFCPTGLMIGHYTDGGFAELIVIPARNALRLPENIPFEQGATLMCASATAYHALRKSHLAAGESVAIIGVGGLGMSAVQLARSFGALDVLRWTSAKKVCGLRKATARYRSTPDQVTRWQRSSGAPVAGAWTCQWRCSAVQRRCSRRSAVFHRWTAVIVGIGNEPLVLDTYHEILGGEASLIGSNDHLLSELPTVIELARRGILDTTRVVTRTIPLDAAAINAAIDGLERNDPGIRTVVVP